MRDHLVIHINGQRHEIRGQRAFQTLSNFLRYDLCLTGTKVVCAVGTGPRDVRDVVRIPTTTPEETLGRVVAYFHARRAEQPLAAIGIGSFGPLDLRPSSPAHGRIARTPKPGWSGADLVGTFARALAVPIGFDTDVNAAALAFLSAANWAYTWLVPGADTDALADRFYALLLDGIRGYSTPA